MITIKEEKSNFKRRNLQKIVKKRKKSHDLDKYLIFCFTVLIIYIIAHTIIFACTGQEASTLSVLVFGVFGTSEPIICGLIKIFKLKNEYKLKKDPEEQEDLQEEGAEG